MTGVAWTRASDRFGRKPVLICGVIFTAINTVIFGLSQSYAHAMVSRYIFFPFVFYFSIFFLFCFFNFFFFLICFLGSLSNNPRKANTVHTRRQTQTHTDRLTDIQTTKQQNNIRLVWGMLDGNAGVVKTVLGEISTPETQARLYSLMATVGGVGMMFKKHTLLFFFYFFFWICYKIQQTQNTKQKLHKITQLKKKVV